MVNSAFWTFSDPVEYGRAVRACDAAPLKVTAHSFKAELTRVDLGRVWMQRLSESGPRVAQITMHPDRQPILFRADLGHTIIRHNGQELRSGELLVVGPAVIDHQSTEGPVGLGSASLTPEDVLHYGNVLAGRDLMPPRRSEIVRPAPQALTRLAFLNAAAAHLAQTSPSTLSHPEVARAFEDSFTVAIVRCLAEADPIEQPSARERRVALVGRMLDYLAAQPSQAVYLVQVCAAIGATERSLERACQNVLGMGPKRYLMLRRLHLARGALLTSDGAETTVSSIALEHGFWEIGRFAVKYRELFGESPSITLRRPRRDRQYGRAELAIGA